MKSAPQEPSKNNSWTGRNFAFVAIILVIATLGAALLFADLSVEAIVTRVQEEAISDELEALVEGLRHVGQEGNPRAKAAKSLLYKVATLLPQSGIETEG